MTDYPDLCGNEPSCQKPELLKRIRELEQANVEQALLIAELKGLREPKIQHLEQRISELEDALKYIIREAERCDFYAVITVAQEELANE